MTAGARKNADSQLILTLACGGTVEAAAKAAGVSEGTAYRRLHEPEFRKRVEDAKAEMVTRAVARLSAASTAAADTLHKLLTARSETVRLGAARSILELGSRLREAEDLAARSEALEQQLGELQPTKSGGQRWGA